MGHIYWDLPEIPIPEEAYINRSDGRVFLIIRKENHKQERPVIGRAVSDTMMHPNEEYRFRYPELWKQFYGEKSLPKRELHVGLYALVLSSAWVSGLYPLLQKETGPLRNNAIFDYCMFCIRERTNATYLIEDSLQNQVTFSDKLHSDSWYSDFFKNKWSLDSIHNFKIQWLQQCAKDHKKVWLCIDGSNNDCNVRNSQLAERGNAKSHKEVPIYGYIWAVSAKDGTPITWFVNNGGKIDSKAFEKIAKFLGSSNLSVEGVIVDRGFATESILQLIRACGYRYIVMLKSTSLAFQTMMTKHAEAIHCKVRFVVNERGLFGISERCKVFASGTEEACVGLYYDAVRGNKSALKQISEVLAAGRAINGAIAQGKPKSKLPIPASLKKFLNISGKEENPKFEYCYDTWQKAVDDKGYSAIASSTDLTAKEISELYDLRDVSEKQFSYFKSQEGFDVTRTQDDTRIEVKLAVGFVASIVRTFLERACRCLGLDTNKMLREADRCVLALGAADKYLAIHDQSERLRNLFAALGMTDEHLDGFAEEQNVRRKAIHSQTREMPPFKPKEKRGPGRPPKPKEEDSTAGDPKPEKKGPGRPAGRKNNKTLERERLAAEAAARGEPPPVVTKKGPGRPPGRKNNKTLERERLAAEAAARGEMQANDKNNNIGRPQGSKNKSTLVREKRTAKRQTARAKKKNIPAEK